MFTGQITKVSDGNTVNLSQALITDVIHADSYLPNTKPSTNPNLNHNPTT